MWVLVTWLTDSREDKEDTEEQEEQEEVMVVVVDEEEQEEKVMIFLEIGGQTALGRELSRHSSRACVPGHTGVPTRVRALCF